MKQPLSGIDTFKIYSSDGSTLIINNKEVINKDGFTSERAREGKIALSKGLHPFVITYFQAKYGKELKLSATAPDGTKIYFDAQNVYY